MFTNRHIYVVLTLSVSLLVYSCKHKPGAIPTDEVANSHFPSEVGKIIVTKCATSGCHDVTGYENAGGLLLDSWEHLFDGANNGAVAVAYSPEYSSLMYFINTDSSRGPVAQPTMPYNKNPPYNRPPLTKEEYDIIKDWIAEGAPDKDGNIPFGTDMGTRQKVYTIQQECDLLAVVDAEKNLVMRYISIGKKPYPESISDIKSSPDGRYVYISYWFSPYIQKVDAMTDRLILETDLGNSFWSTLAISKDGTKLIVSNEDDNTVNIIDANSLQKINSYKFDMIRPRSVIANASFDTIYASSRLGNTVYKIAGNSLKKISIDNNPLQTNSTATSPNPWALLMSPDGSRYFVTCAKTNEVRVMSTRNDSLIKVIPVGVKPQEMTLSAKQPYLFVTCIDDPSAALKSRGSVYVINYQTLEVVKRMEGKLFEPYGISVDDRKGEIYVFSKNLNSEGPAPHHGSPCNGRNGFYHIFDINTLEQKSSKRHEILVDPGASQVRFK